MKNQIATNLSLVIITSLFVLSSLVFQVDTVQAQGSMIVDTPTGPSQVDTGDSGTYNTTFHPFYLQGNGWEGYAFGAWKLYGPSGTVTRNVTLNDYGPQSKSTTFTNMSAGTYDLCAEGDLDLVQYDEFGEIIWMLYYEDESCKNNITVGTVNPPIDGICASTVYNCTSGTSANNTNGNIEWTWQCQGINGGSNDSCSEYKPSVSQNFTVEDSCTFLPVSNATITIDVGCAGLTRTTDGSGFANFCAYYDSNIDITITKSGYLTTTSNNANVGSGGTDAFGLIPSAGCGGGPAPDLITTAFNVPNGTPSQVVTATATVRNQGNASTGGSFDVAANRDFSGNMLCSTTEHGQTSTASLGSNTSRDVSFTMTLPSVAGTYTATAMADADCQITESDESNETRTDTYTVSASAMPDLTASAPTPATATVNVSLTFSSTITNNGNASTGTSFPNFFQVSSAASGSGALTDLTSSSMATLGSGASASATSPTYTFTSAGTYSVRTCADKVDRNTTTSTDSVNESDENDNCSSWTNVVVSSGAPAPTANLTCNL